MIISVNWLKQFTDIEKPIDELVALIGSRLVEVEAVIDLGAKYAGVLIADVKQVAPHPNANKLRVVHIDDGGANKTARRLKNGLIEVVCGAPNVRQGIKVAWIPPGAVVPATIGKENLVLEARELRGVVSHGMLASARELAIGDDHGGILEVDKKVPAGTTFAQTYELNDYLLDIENKSLTHRPDCFGLIGFAREVAAIGGKQFTTPTWLQATEPVLAPMASTVKPLEVLTKIAQPEVSKRYQVVAFEAVDASKQSPFAIKTWLSRVGIRPISAVVDITNYLMYLTGQPLHAFDLDAVIAEHPKGKAEIIVRESIEGEKLTLLDGRTITLAHDDILICAGEKPIALAGAMGGATTEITEKTTRVLLESATFDLYRLRATQMRHGIFSEAITRFTKGQPPAQTAPVLASAARMLGDIVGARRISEIIDEYPGQETPEPIEVSAKTINAVLGTNYDQKIIVETLEHIECKVGLPPSSQPPASSLHITPPFWRVDLHIPEDIIEEIGRVNGFDSVTPQLPLRSFKPVSPSTFDKIRSRVRQTLARAGANEVLTYSFVPEKLLIRAGQDPAEAFKIINALSHDLQYYRLSLTPNLLEKIHPNIKAGYETFALFELGKAHNKLHKDKDEPREHPLLSLVYTNQKPGTHSPAAFYNARRFLDYLAGSLGFTLAYNPINDDLAYPVVKPFNLRRSALVSIQETGESLGIIGEYTPSVARALKLPAHTAGFEVGLQELASAANSRQPYAPLSRYPGTSRDITLQVSDDVNFADVEKVVASVLAQTQLEASLEPISVYKPTGPEGSFESQAYKNKKDASAHKHVTLRLHLTNHERTITTDEANSVVNQVTAAAHAELDAQVV